MDDFPTKNKAESVSRLSQTTNRWELTAERVLAFVGVLQVAVLLLAALEGYGIGVGPLRVIVAVALLSVGPGLLVLLFIGVRDKPPLVVLLHSAGASAIVLMTVGVVISLSYPVIGIQRPISEVWVLTSVAGVNLILGLLVLSRVERDAVLIRARKVQVRPVHLGFLLLLLFGILSIGMLNTLGTNLPVLLFLFLLSLVPLYLVTRAATDSVAYPLAIWVGALSLLYLKSLWAPSYPLEMWMHGMVLEQGRWMPVVGGNPAALPDIRGVGQEGVLTDAVLYPMYALTAGIKMITQLEVVNPLFVSLVPLGLYETFRRYISRRDATIAVFLFIFTFRFYSQHYPNAPRDVMATLFLVLLALLVADTRIDERSIGILTPLFITGVAVSHYGTSYLFLVALLLSAVALILLGVLRKDAEQDETGLLSLSPIGPGTIVTYTMMLFAGVLILTWYLFTADGVKFEILAGAIERVMSPVTVSGLASERVLSEKPLSVELTRSLVIVIFGLIGVGILSELIRKLLSLPSSVRDEHLVISLSFFTIFGLSFLSLGAGFGKGRILMITLAFASLFAVLGLYEVQSLISSFSARFRRLTGTLSGISLQQTFAVFLCVYLLVNTGVVAETVTQGDDYGSSVIVNNERLAQSSSSELRLRSEGCIDCDVQSQVWVLRYGAVDEGVRDGGLAKSYYWYGHSLVTQIDRFVDDYFLADRSTLYKSDLPAEWSAVEEGTYIRLTHDNHDGEVVLLGEDGEVSFDAAQQSLGSSDKVYSAGDSTVYQYHEPVTNATDETA